jgi:hypothetical protein
VAAAARCKLPKNQENPIHPRHAMPARCAHRLLPLLAVIVVATVAMADGLISEALADLKKYLKAASSVVVQAATGLEAAKFSTINQDQRSSLKAELSRLADKLGGIFVSQSSLVNQLEFYVRTAKNPSTTEDDKKTFWNRIVQPHTRRVYDAVRDVQTIVESSGRLFDVALSPDDRLALGDNLMARGIALKSFETMAPPVSAGDVLELEGLIADYKVLIQNLLTLRRAIDAVQRRLADE